MYPFQGGGPAPAPPAYDQYGSQASISPVVGRSTAGALAPGQTLMSACGRMQTSATATTTISLFTVPASKTFFLTDFQLSTIAGVEIDTQLDAGSIPIARAVTSNTSPIGALYETQPVASGGLAISLVLPQTSGGAVYVDFFVAGYFQSNPGNY